MHLSHLAVRVRLPHGMTCPSGAKRPPAKRSRAARTVSKAGLGGMNTGWGRATWVPVREGRALVAPGARAYG
jgi:hypothetical protein